MYESSWDVIKRYYRLVDLKEEGEGEMAQQIGALINCRGLISRTHMVNHNHNSSSGNPIPSTGLWAPGINAGKTFIHIKYFKPFNFFIYSSLIHYNLTEASTSLHSSESCLPHPPTSLLSRYTAPVSLQKWAGLSGISTEYDLTRCNRTRHTHIRGWAR